jgi:hypothetical protein
MDVMHFDYKGITVRYDPQIYEDEYWHITIDGQDRSFREPKHAKEHVEKYLDYAKNIGKVLYSVSKHWNPDNHKYGMNVIEKHVVTKTFYQDQDNGDRMGLFMVDEKGDTIDTYGFFTDEEHVSLLTELIENEEKRDKLIEEMGDIYDRIRAVAPINC